MTFQCARLPRPTICLNSPFLCLEQLNISVSPSRHWFFLVSQSCCVQHALLSLVAHDINYLLRRYKPSTNEAFPCLACLTSMKTTMFSVVFSLRGVSSVDTLIPGYKKLIKQRIHFHSRNSSFFTQVFLTSNFRLNCKYKSLLEYLPLSLFSREKINRRSSLVKLVHS